MRLPRHFQHRALLVLAVFAALLGFAHAAQSGGAGSAGGGPAAARLAAVHSAAVHSAAVRNAVVPTAAASSAAHGQAHQPVHAVTVADELPAATGGACAVPGIGDIGSLFGLCTAGQSGLTGDLNNICQPSLPDPEQANSGIDAMVRPPASSGPQPTTLYGSYGVAGQYWAATNLQCSDMTSLIGNNVASMVFDIAKSIDRVTITIYQSAAGVGILSWLTNVVDKLVSSLGNAIYFPYLSAVVIIGAIWLAWQGLIRKRGTRTIEGTIWMVVACAAAIWLIGEPADFTGAGTAVSNGISQSLNTAFSKLPAPSQSNCLPLTKNDPQVQPSNFNFSSGNGIVAENANELWAVLVCKPWLIGEFGTSEYGTTGSTKTVVNDYGRQLLWAQAIATNETPTTALSQAKQATYNGIASSLQQKDPGIYPLFQGKQWTTRLEIAFAALFAAAIAGVLVLLIAVTLILLKLGFLLLLVVGPFFLLIGTHPGFGRVVALRWFEMLVGVLLKQAAVALVLSVLLYAYSLIMGTSDAVLPWALKILMIALVTIAVFIYRRPFQHLFSAVGYGMIGSTERAEIDLQRSRTALRQNTLAAAAAAVPGIAAYRAARWARRNPGMAGALSTAAGGGVGAAAAAGMPGADGASVNGEDSEAAAAGIAPPDGGTRAGSRSGLASRARAWAASAAGDGARPSAPPLNLPSRETAGSATGARARGNSGAGPVPPGRTAADAAAVAAGTGTAQAGAVRAGTASGHGPGGPGRSRPVPSRAAQPPRAQAGPAPAAPAAPAAASPPRASSAPASPARATPAAGSPGPASSGPAGPAPAAAPSRSGGSGWPWRPGMAPRAPQASPSAAPSAAPSAPSAPPGRSLGGPWADSSAGRQSAAPARPPAAPARPPAAPARPPAGSGRPPAAPARPPARPATPAPAQRGRSGRGESGPWADSSAGRQSAAPARGPAATSNGEPSRGGGTAGPSPAGSNEAGRPEGPAPFWLRPIRRRK
jgi:TrbL/VirB6 plasmid conjugal transfer protein